ncbi:PREDICTED: uncharacterized protein LOC105448282 isoform X1 [Wasmannia auropunctata]|uniref:uncharacterized protein LOC105448282 isoform X1 n=1 Tax=Wasmannia auropunctata TaxID=64793 RepID=UPI0005ED7DBE|nr:PREDICTED: uncharacterized protein LOC105448282 isoform X1 [Wasmannia auropunctata]
MRRDAAKASSVSGRDPTCPGVEVTLFRRLIASSAVRTTDLRIRRRNSEEASARVRIQLAPENGDYFQFRTGSTFDRRLILRPTAKGGRIYPINLMTDIVGVVELARGKIHEHISSEGW